MKTLTPTQKLDNAITLLEIRQSRQLNEIKDQFENLVESVKPINIIKNTLNEFRNTPNTKSSIIGSLTSIASGYLSRRLTMGASSNIFKKLGGFALQYVVTNFASKKNN